MTPNELLYHFDQSTKDAADAIGVTPQTIRDWTKAGEIPPHWQSHIQLQTRGRLKADNLKARA